jgi:DNA-directed RNA polymerase subunit delta
MPKESSLIDAAVAIMSHEKQAFDLFELFDRIAEEFDLPADQHDTMLNKFYTDLVTSAKFTYVGDNHWNLKANEKIELWEKDGSYYKEYNVVELPEEYKIDPYAQTKKPKPPTQPKEEVVVAAPVEEVTPEEVVEEPIIEPVIEPVVEPVVEDEPVVEVEEEFEDEEIFEDYDEFDEEKYNEYMDNYEDQYDD